MSPIFCSHQRAKERREKDSSIEFCRRHKRYLLAPRRNTLAQKMYKQETEFTEHPLTIFLTPQPRSPSKTKSKVKIDFQKFDTPLIKLKNAFFICDLVVEGRELMGVAKWIGGWCFTLLLSSGFALHVDG